VLDRVQDPGNLGTLLRNAVALDWDAVYLLDGCCDPFNEKAVRASKGALFRLTVDRGTWAGLHHHLTKEGFCMLAATAADCCPSQLPHEHVSTSSFDRLDNSKVALVLGSEGQGVQDEILQHCHQISIPMSAAMESMNVAAAGSMLMFTLSSALRSVLDNLGRVIK
jgi:RNA methyltransferase, TrmH family